MPKANGALLGKHAILAARDREHRDVEVPEWGGSVRLRMMSGRERDAYIARVSESDKPEHANEFLLALTLIDEDGNRLFTEDEVGEIADKSWQVIERLALAAVELNRMHAGAVEDAEKN